MGEDREIGASVLAGVRAARPPSPEEPRCSVRRVSAGRGHLTRRGQAWSDGNGGRARSLAALARGALARLPSLRCACGLLARGGPASRGPARPGRARGGSRASVSRFVSSSSPSNTQSLPSTSLRTCSFFPSRQTHTPLARRARRTAANARAVPQGRCCTCCPASRVPGRRASRSSLLSVLPLEKRSARPPRCDADMSPPW